MWMKFNFDLHKVSDVDIFSEIMDKLNLSEYLDILFL